MLSYTFKCTKNAFGGRSVPGVRTRWGACSTPPDPVAEFKWREWETGEGEGREGEMEEEVKGRRKGEDPHCMKCVDTHADLPIIKH